ncbi:uncharacterized protein LOC143869748 [Tasmannia lanceolata]|uniref:uncharacterized protein LOC143869748 n=1 Tax=Tasmannia lanceolata TaxID=3420 RepID=UPI004063BBDC
MEIDTVWRSILWRFSTRRKPLKSIEKEEEWIRKEFPGRNIIDTAMRIAFNSAIHHTWLERNNKIFEGKKNHKQIILREILANIRVRIIHLGMTDSPNPRSLLFAKSFNLNVSPSDIPEKFSKWIPPPKGRSKVNIDASLEENRASIGGIIRNGKGMASIAFSVNTSEKSIQQLEMEAIHKRIHLASDEGIGNLWIESDSLTSALNILGTIRCHWKQRPLLHSIHSKLISFKSWEITHVWRESNGVVDYLSKVECPIKGERLLPSSFTMDLLQTISSDAQGTLYKRQK